MQYIWLVAICLLQVAKQEEGGFPYVLGLVVEDNYFSFDSDVVSYLL